MPIDTAYQHALDRRYRERRWLAAACVTMAVGLSVMPMRMPWVYFAAHGLPFILVHFLWLRRRVACDPALLPIVYALTGIGLLQMLSIEGGAYAQGFVIGSAAGVLVIGGISFVDTRRAFWRRRHYVWLMFALVTALIVFLAGSGPAGSSARINLDIPYLGRVQPVEALKLFLLLFMAGFFAHNWRFLRELRERSSRASDRARLLRGALSSFNVPRLRDVLPVTAGVAVAVGSCFLLRDMGPALVMGCTFLLLYGAARGRWTAVIAGLATMAGAFWLIYVTGAVPVVADRMAMLLSPWDNVVRGGEHLAHAYWAMASGGLQGVGLGLGSAGAIPAGHTDMVLPAVGEELGFVGFAVVLLLYGILLVRAVQTARRASGSFGLFLAVGIALMLLFQLVLIAGGTTGLTPLSGVATPFLSYGKSSMLVNCVLIGLLASISRTARSDPQTDPSFIVPLRITVLAVGLLLTSVGARAFFVQVLKGDEWIVKPALVLRDSGRRSFAYNPRIYEARERLGRGTIYDRNGVVLAVHDSARSYPFGAETFYLLGDAGRRVKWGADNSLYAEHRYLSYLRGYDNHPQTVLVDGRAAVRYDYGELRPLIGPPNETAARMIAVRRDLILTVDVRLQQRVTDILEELAPEGHVASAVVLDAHTGEVLASATVPLPSLDASGHKDPNAFDRGYGRGAKAPGSIAKLVTAMAAFQAEGSGVEHWTQEIHKTDRYARRGEPAGTVDLRRALVSSSNVYFAALAHEVVGPERLVAAFGEFGFRMGGPGLSMSEQVELLRRPDNLRQAGFGQGPVVASPLAAAQVAATVATGGVHVPVRWVLTPSADGLPRPRRVVARDQARILADAMRGVVADRRGTAPLLRDAPIPIAGKTGTAEEDGSSPVNHAWFAGFAPYHDAADEAGAPIVTTADGAAAGRIVAAADDRQGSRPSLSRRILAVGVLVEAGGHGGTVAAPIAQAIFEQAAALGIIASSDLSEATPSSRESTRLIPRADR